MAKRMAVDASVIVKWYLDDEEHNSQARRLRDDLIEGSIDVIAPSLLVYEVVNAINVAANRGRLQPADAHLILRNFLAFSLPTVEGDDLAAEAFALAQSYHRSAYDAAYMALAQLLSVPLQTGDRRLYDAVHRDLPWVLWIGDYPQD